jgi:hypothetical protein
LIGSPASLTEKSRTVYKKVLGLMAREGGATKDEVITELETIYRKKVEPDGRIKFYNDHNVERARIDPPGKDTDKVHLHLYDENGNPLDDKLFVQKRENPSVHHKTVDEKLAERRGAADKGGIRASAGNRDAGKSESRKLGGGRQVRA